MGLSCAGEISDCVALHMVEVPLVLNRAEVAVTAVEPVYHARFKDHFLLVLSGSDAARSCGRS